MVPVAVRIYDEFQDKSVLVDEIFYSSGVRAGIDAQPASPSQPSGLNIIAESCKETLAAGVPLSGRFVVWISA